MNFSRSERGAFFMPHHFIKALVKNKARAGLKAGVEVATTAAKQAPTPRAPKPKAPKATTPTPPPIPKQVQDNPVSPEQALLDAKTDVYESTRQLAREGKPPKKVKPPRAKWTKEQRDAGVDTNTYPKRTEVTNNADFRGITGDIQAGNKGLAIRMEDRPEYIQAQTGQATLNRQDSRPFTPHHRMGIQDQQAFVAGKTPQQMDTRRSNLETGGLYIGNVEENLESLYDGVFTQGGKKADIKSTDHKVVHQLADELRQKEGVVTNEKDRSLDTFYGTFIKDMPEDQQLALQLRLGWLDELAIDKVQNARYKAFMKKYGHLPYAERHEIILNNPELFANLSTNV
jgi:hypothetical protein